MSESRSGERFRVVHFGDLAAVKCPCGLSRRGFMDEPEGDVSVHLVEIREDSRPHYHSRLTEIYFVLEGVGEIELDGQRFPLRPGTAVKIRPGCRHRAVGRLKILNVVVPRFDPDDEWFD